MQKSLRWLAIFPAFIVAALVPEYIVRIVFLIMRSPVILFKKITGSGTGPIGKLTDGIANILFGIDCIEALMVFVSGVLTGWTIIYLLSWIAPTNTKATAQVFAIFFLLFILFGFVIQLISVFKFDAYYDGFLDMTAWALGIIMCWHSIKNKTEKEQMQHE